jgi:hypothetical protein
MTTEPNHVTQHGYVTRSLQFALVAEEGYLGQLIQDKLTIAAAQGISVLTIDFPDPYIIDYTNNEFFTLPNNISFQYPITNNIQTLSPKNADSDPYGILFIPDLKTEECRQSEEKYILKNATRYHHLPPDTNYSLVALAPWFSPTCMQEYFEKAREERVVAFLVYQPGISAVMPPPMNDASWGLGDGGTWKAANNFPTYAIMPVSGGILAEQLSVYSGNVTDAPYGQELSSMLNPTDYVRLWARVRIGKPLNPPFLCLNQNQGLGMRLRVSTRDGIMAVFI